MSEELRKREISLDEDFSQIEINTLETFLEAITDEISSRQEQQRNTAIQNFQLAFQALQNANIELYILDEEYRIGPCQEDRFVFI